MKIIQISDLHFGKENPTVVKTLLASISRLKPDLVIVSGDLTQRALRSQFLAAKVFLDEIQARKIIVPGNHDIPLYNIFQRFLYPFGLYKKYISKTLTQEYAGKCIRILGVNSAYPFHGKRGKLVKDQLNYIRKFFSGAQESVRILIMHHNFIKLPGMHSVVINKDEVLEALGEAKIDIVLSGHLHVPFMKHMNLEKDSHRVYFITAGTAVSTRLRNSVNSFNYMEVDSSRFMLQFYNLEDNIFVPQDVHEYILSR